MINVSIVTYFTPVSDVIKAISICQKSTLVGKIYIIDNSPIDVLSKSLAINQKVNYIHNPKNTGYGAGHNIAMKESLSQKVPFHLVLNADVIFDYTLLRKIILFADKNKNIGLISPKMLFEDGSIQCSRKLLPNPINMLFRAFLPKFLRKSIDHKFELVSFGYDNLLSVPYVSGAFMFLRTSILDEIGLFDERFFMYPEDIDLSRRVAKLYQVIFVPDFVITHKYGGATRKNIKMFIIHIVNMIRYFNKWGWVMDKDRRALNKRALENNPLSNMKRNL